MGSNPSLFYTNPCFTYQPLPERGKEKSLRGSLYVCARWGHFGFAMVCRVKGLISS